MTTQTDPQTLSLDEILKTHSLEEMRQQRARHQEQLKNLRETKEISLKRWYGLSVSACHQELKEVDEVAYHLIKAQKKNKPKIIEALAKGYAEQEEQLLETIELYSRAIELQEATESADDPSTSEDITPTQESEQASEATVQDVGLAPSASDEKAEQNTGDLASAEELAQTEEPSETAQEADTPQIESPAPEPIASAESEPTNILPFTPRQEDKPEPLSIEAIVSAEVAKILTQPSATEPAPQPTPTSTPPAPPAYTRTNYISGPIDHPQAGRIPADKRLYISSPSRIYLEGVIDGEWRRYGKPGERWWSTNIKDAGEWAREMEGQGELPPKFEQPNIPYAKLQNQGVVPPPAKTNGNGSHASHLDVEFAILQEINLLNVVISARPSFPKMEVIAPKNKTKMLTVMFAYREEKKTILHSVAKGDNLKDAFGYEPMEHELEDLFRQLMIEKKVQHQPREKK